MDVAIKIESDSIGHGREESSLAIEKKAYDDMGVQRK